jgi:hypothetical protein
MSVPTTGLLIALIGFWFFLFAPRFLYAAMIISVPFSATAVANLQWGGEEKSLAAWLFLGTLWVVRDAVSGSPLWRKRGWFSSRRTRLAWMAFLAAVVASLCVPLVLNGTAWVPNPDQVSNQTIPIRFGVYNLTQTAYLAFGVVLAILTATENCRSSRLFYTLRLYVGSCIFVGAWGLLQFWCNVTGRVYPAYLFNTSTEVSALGYKQTLALGLAEVNRVSSAALEPSILAEELLVALVVLLVSIRIGRPILSKKWDYLAVAVIGTTLLASTSTTAYAGILLALLIAAVTLARARKPAGLYVILVGVAAGLAALVAAMVPLAGQLASMMLANKSETYSGLGRLISISLAARDFLRYPIFGVGWHAVDCWDLVFLILANTGLLGLITFGSFLFPVLRGLWAGAKRGGWAAVVFLPMVTLMVILAEGAGLSYAAGYVWLVFGLGAGALAATQSEYGREVSEAADSSAQRVSLPSMADGAC